jgi:hypothetical protein
MKHLLTVARNCRSAENRLAVYWIRQWVLFLCGVLFLKRLQVLARLEAYSFSGRNIHFRTRSWVPANSSLPRLDREDAEAPQLNPIIGFEGVFHAIEDGIYSLFRFRLTYPGPLNDLVHKIEFDHCSLRISFINIFLTSGVMLGNGN